MTKELNFMSSSSLALQPLPARRQNLQVDRTTHWHAWAHPHSSERICTEACVLHPLCQCVGK